VAAGFAVAGVGDASSGTATTTVRYGAGQGAKAQLLARHLEGEVVLVEDPGLEGVDAVVVTGATFAGVRSSPGPPAEAPSVTETTTTTAAPAPAEGGEPAPAPEC
jgi:hypothetical protein